MTTANEYKKYRDLLSALAEYVKHSDDDKSGLDCFLTGYAGGDWEAEKEKAGIVEDVPYFPF